MRAGTLPASCATVSGSGRLSDADSSIAPVMNCEIPWLARGEVGVMRRTFLLIAALLFVGMSHPADASRAAWEHLGAKEIEGHADHDKISCHGKETYTALQFRVRGAAVQFDRVVVEYGNHVRRPYPFRFRVRANGVSPVLDLAGAERDLTSVEFWYEKASWGNKPEVRLYGRR